MPEFLQNILLAFGGYLFHLLKMYLESVNRNEAFINKKFYISVAMNVLAIFLLTYLGKTLPPDLLVMSPLTCVIIGFSASSVLAGFINVKSPKLPTPPEDGK